MIGRCLLLKKNKKRGALKNSSQLSVTIIPHIYRKEKRKMLLTAALILNLIFDIVILIKLIKLDVK